jgi:hypothetical protein
MASQSQTGLNTHCEHTQKRPIVRSFPYQADDRIGQQSAEKGKP